MTRERRDSLKADARQAKRALLSEPVGVEPEPDPRRPRILPEQPADQFQVAGSVIFKFRRLPETIRTGCPAQRTADASSVPTNPAAAARESASLRMSRRKHWGVWAAAVRSRSTRPVGATVGIKTPERIERRNRRDRRSVGTSCFDHPGDQRRGDRRTGAVVDQNEVGRLETCAGVGLCASLVEGLEAQSCRLLTGRPTRTEENPGTGAGQERRHCSRQFSKPDAGRTSTTRSMAGWPRSASTARTASGRPASGRNCFGASVPPKRLPAPAATTTAPARTSDSIADTGAVTGRGPSPSARTATSSSRAGHSAEWIPFGFRTARRNPIRPASRSLAAA